MPLLFLFNGAIAQDRVKAPVKFKIEDGDFKESTVTIRNITTNESNSLPGNSKIDLDLKLNCEYLLSFQKPGYITKRIAFNTTAPAERSSQGFHPFNFEVNLFKQYDGVNIVVFNQPVGKIEFSRIIDDFDYDTDYTKQIHSALKAAEEEIKAKQVAERALAVQQKKEDEKRQAAESAKARADLKVKQESEKKAAEEARKQAIADAAKKRLEDEEKSRQAKVVMEEEKRQKAIAKMEEEERNRLIAVEQAEARKNASSTSGSENPAKNASSISGSEKNSVTAQGAGAENRNVTQNPEVITSGTTHKPAPGTGDEHSPLRTAGATPGHESGVTKAIGISVSDPAATSNEQSFRKNDAATQVNSTQSSVQSTNNQMFEQLQDISVEEIMESNRKITRVTVRKGEGAVIFSKVSYHWGGVYYFLNRMSITEHHYFSVTGLH